MLLPVALAVLDTADNKQALRVPLLLGICYAASIGGMGTPIGTPPNLIFMEIYSQSTGLEITFLEWMAWGVPLVLCLLPIAAWWLTRKLNTVEIPPTQNRGPWQAAEIRVLLIFGLTVLLWITRKDPFGGWSHLLDLEHTHDGYTALIACLLLFAVSDGKGRPLMDWEATKELPWGIILLVAGGIALSLALKSSGLVDSLAGQLQNMPDISLFGFIFVVCLGVTFLTEFMSNSASTALLMPVFYAVAVGINYDPKLLMIAAALSASCAFMMPMATGPNAIIFGSNRLSIHEMMKQGFGLNLLCAGALSLFIYLLFT